MITDFLQRLVGPLVPTTRRLRIDRGRQQPSIGQELDVDRLHAVLRKAEGGDPADLFALYRDIIAGHAHTQAEFSKRKLAVLGDEFRILPKDADDPVQVQRAQQLQDDLQDLPNWTAWLSHLLGSALWPISVYERVWRVSSRPDWRFELGDIQPIPHPQLTWPDGLLSLRVVAEDGSFSGQTELPDPARVCSHRGNLLSEVPDWWGGPMRALLFWWLFATMDRDWWARFLDRFGSPFLVGKYPDNDEDARYALHSAFSAATKLLGVVVSENAKIEMQQAATGNGDAFEKFHAVANREISKLIVGQTASSEGTPGRLGGDDAQMQVRDDLRALDAQLLSAHFRVAILRPLWLINGWTTPLPTAVWGRVAEDEDDVDATGSLFSAAAAISQAGYRLSDAGIDALNKRTRYPIERAAVSAAPVGPFSLSALSAPADPLTGIRDYPLLPSLERRRARQSMAKAACEDIVADAAPRLARHLRSRAAAVRQVIVSADSPLELETALTALAADLDPSDATQLVETVLAAASANAVLALD